MIRHADGGSTPASTAHPHIAALSGALNADKGVRAHAVHLVIVEQTLRQGVWGGLNAVPAAVLAQAMPQLARLSLFRTSLELQLLFQCMHQVVEAHGQPTGLGATASGTKDGRARLDSGITASARLDNPWTGSVPRQTLSSPVGHADRDGGNNNDDDDFPDTQAFDDDEEVPVPMPPVGRGTAIGAGGFGIGKT